eukprot:12406246-Karenia_brevis.AAC.1
MRKRFFFPSRNSHIMTKMKMQKQRLPRPTELLKNNLVVMKNFVPVWDTWATLRGTARRQWLHYRNRKGWLRTC